MKAVVHGLAGADELQLHAAPVCPLVESSAGELRPVVDDDDLWKRTGFVGEREDRRRAVAHGREVVPSPDGAPTGALHFSTPPRLRLHRLSDQLRHAELAI